MPVRCPKCDEPIGSDVNAGRVVCPSCGEQVLAPAERDRASWRPMPVRKPKTMWREVDVGRGRRLELRPWRVIPLLLLGCCVAGWNALGRGVRSPVFTAFIVLLLSVGLLQIFTRHFIQLDRDSLFIGTRPIPCWSPRLPTAQVARFEAATSPDSVMRRKRYGDRSWLRVIMRDGRAEELRVPMESPEVAALVAARLNETLAEVRRQSAYRG